MSRLIAATDLHIGETLSLDGEPFVEDGEVVCRLTQAEARNSRNAIGVARRAFAKGEWLAYDPSGNTKDIITKFEWTGPFLGSLRTPLVQELQERIGIGRVTRGPSGLSIRFKGD